MRETISTEQLERWVYVSRASQSAIVYLRENIEFVESDEEDSYWRADECVVETELAESEIEDHFDELWVRASREEMGLEGRIARLEEMLDATMAVVLGEE